MTPVAMMPRAWPRASLVAASRPIPALKRRATGAAPAELVSLISQIAGKCLFLLLSP